MKYPVLLLILPLLLVACGDDPPPAEAGADASPAGGALSGMEAVITSPNIGGGHGASAVGHGGVAATGALRTGEVKETMTTAGYTYVRVDTGSGVTWAAGPETTVAVGQRVEMPVGQAMANFHSASLDRDFDEVWFVDWIRPEGSSPAPAASADPHGGMSPSGTSGTLAPAGDIEPLEGGQTVAGVFALSGGSDAAVRGRLVKINRGILGSDWLHLQDGTGSAADKTHDLVVTASTGVQADVGDVVVVRGKVATNKDFGAGYTYALLVEEATVTVE